MAVPKKKLTKTRQGKRRSHLALKKQNLTTCKKCNEIKLSHKVCNTCGYYDDIQVYDFSKDDKKLKNKNK